jgi:hypothetical protein
MSVWDFITSINRQQQQLETARSEADRAQKAAENARYKHKAYVRRKRGQGAAVKYAPEPDSDYLANAARLAKNLKRRLKSHKEKGQEVGAGIRPQRVDFHLLSESQTRDRTNELRDKIRISAPGRAQTQCNDKIH